VHDRFEAIHSDGHIAETVESIYRDFQSQPSPGCRDLEPVEWSIS
jgi:hypothetical protein